MSQEQLDSTAEGRITALEIRMAVAESDIKAMKEKLTKIDSNTSWTVKLVLGCIILAVVNMLLKGTP